MHYFQFNISDWINGTNHLDHEEEFCYFKLILEYYDSENPLDLDIKKLSRRIRLRGKEDLVESILDEFFEKTESGWINARCDTEISAYHNKADKARENGKKGGRPKKNKNLKKPTGFNQLTEQEPNPNQEESESKANYKPLTNNHKLETNKHKLKTNLDNNFENFWKQTKFPKRPQDTKGDMKKKYAKLLKEKVKPEDILFASDIFAEVHRGNEFAIGMRKFLDSKENIEEMLTEDVRLKNGGSQEEKSCEQLAREYMERKSQGKINNVFGMLNE